MTNIHQNGVCRHRMYFCFHTKLGLPSLIKEKQNKIPMLKKEYLGALMHLVKHCFMVLHNDCAPFLERLVILLSEQKDALVQSLGKTFICSQSEGSSVFISFRRLLDGTEA